MGMRLVGLGMGMRLAGTGLDTFISMLYNHAN